MDLNEYQRLAARTSGSADSDPDVRICISALGIAGEAGEVADFVKKWIGHGHDPDAEKLKKELGDVLWYVSDIATLCQMSLNDVAATNIEKLRKRYPDGFSVEASRNRPMEPELPMPDRIKLLESRIAVLLEACNAVLEDNRTLRGGPTSRTILMVEDAVEVAKR